MAKIKHPAHLMAQVATLALAAALIGPALYTPAVAGPRKPAPIVYVGQGDLNGAARAKPAGPARMEYRYPDAPNLIHSEEGTRQIKGEAAPIAFSSSKAAISTQEARRIGQGVRAYDTPKPITQSVHLAALEAPAPVGPPGFQPAAGAVYDETGRASIYPTAFIGQPTANGEILTADSVSAAHPTLPLPSLVQLINVKNGREIVVRVNDRGPFEPGHLIEVSPRAGELLKLRPGRADVRIRYLGPASPVTRQTISKVPVSEPTLETVPSAPSRKVLETSIPPLPRKAEAAAVRDTGFIPQGTGDYFIQAGSFADIANAKSLHDRLAKTYSVGIVEARVRGTDYFRVVIGPIEKKSTAEALRNRLAANGTVNGLVIPAK